MKPDSSAIDAALVTRLLGDAPLQAMLPDGVYFDEAGPNATRFIIVSLVDGIDEATFEGRAIEDRLYWVEARALSTAGVNMATAAARIDWLLDDQPLAAPGYGGMTLHREQPQRRTEVDALDPTLRWHRRGGYYRVQMSVGTS